ncbi:MAG: DUF1134 domain-containing protein, partial [Erythrobacter sp.]
MIKPTRILPQIGLLLAAFGLSASPLSAQVETIDPDTAIDGDLVEQPGDQPVYGEPEQATTYTPEPEVSAP